MFQFETVPLINLHARTTGMLSFIMFRANSEGCCKNGAVTLSLPPAGTPSVQQHFICSEKKRTGVWSGKLWRKRSQNSHPNLHSHAFTRKQSAGTREEVPSVCLQRARFQYCFFFNNFNSVDFPLVKFLKDCSNSLVAPLKYVRKENKVTSLQTSGAYPEDFVSQCC